MLKTSRENVWTIIVTLNFECVLWLLCAITWHPNGGYHHRMFKVFLIWILYKGILTFVVLIGQCSRMVCPSKYNIEKQTRPKYIFRNWDEKMCFFFQIWNTNFNFAESNMDLLVRIAFAHEIRNTLNFRRFMISTHFIVMTWLDSSCLTSYLSVVASG